MDEPRAPAPARVLVVDDEPAVNDLICDALALAGYETTSASHGMQALHALRNERIDLVVLDVNMPVMDGFEVLQRMRASGDPTPVIVLTARQDRADTATGFELGADDFVRKPFGVQELTLRVAAVLRRSRGGDPPDVLRHGDLRLSVDQHEVTCGDTPVPLSPTEFRLLEHLLRNCGRVLTKEQLLAAVWDMEEPCETTVLESYISYLRRKLGPAVTIRTVRGVGYQLQRPDRPA